MIKCSIGRSMPIEFLIDSGADVNVLCGKDWDELKREAESGTASYGTRDQLNKTNVCSYATTKPMTVERAIHALVRVVGCDGPGILADFIVVRDGRRSLLGRSTASDLGLLAVGLSVSSCEQTSRSKIFPKMPGVVVKFSIDKTIPPVRNAYFNVPAAFRQAAKQRLAEMEERDIIEKVTTAPKWISGMSAVPKGKNDFRLVVNMRAANRAIKREYYRMPLIDDMKVKLHGAKYFTKLDLSDAFYHLELSPESRDLTTFISENGMFRFKRLMFGVNCAPEVFQRVMTQLLKDVENVVVYIDDILIFARTLAELRKTVATVLQILRKHNLTLNLSKCEFDRTHVKFLGHEGDERGFHVDKEKVKSIENFRNPRTASELRSFLGLASFISPYIQNFADITSSLWTVATTKTWKWSPEQQRDFETVKNKISHCVTALGYFAEHDKTILYTDASPNALGAVLVQEDNKAMPRVISFASKALTSTEKRYAQNQREALGAVWGVEHFSYFLLGRHCVLRTDAQGVAFILNRSRESSKRALTRADGWALRLSPYSYDVEYVRGRDNIADPSSRLYNAHDEPFDELSSPWEIACVESNCFEFLTESEVQEATAEDQLLQQVIGAIESGSWPKSLWKYQSVSEDLSVLNGILIKRGCLVIPESLRKKALDVAHSGHPMAAKMKSILRERVWWPGITVDAEEWVEACQACATTGRPERPTPMKRSFAPKTAWQTIALDFNGPYAKLGGISILVVVDYRSRYLIARPIKSTSFVHTKQILENIFEREGYPQNIKTDNGPPFNSEDYRAYCRERGINAIFSTPLFPQQNGLVEGYMKLVNKAMATSLSCGTSYIDELRAAVDAHNAAAHTVTKVPPEEVMMGRKIRRRLPLLAAGNSNHEMDLVDARDRQAKLRAKEYEDARRGARECRVKPGDVVITERTTRTKGDTRFDPTRFTVTEEDNGNLVLCDDAGKTMRRHVTQTQTRKVKEWRTREPAVDYKDQGETTRRSSNRDRKSPAYLNNYIRVCELEDSERRETI
ncbi:uncharacterized protein K02A2.6-like [Aedes albopictus]|uniref:RNA-directed DNA polymerase n=1 Tax=Aedes albopictus TaxID=7160 RepID=A0ABM1ZFR3_AEDAL